MRNFARSTTLASIVAGARETPRLVIACDDLAWCVAVASQVEARNISVATLANPGAVTALIQFIEQGSVALPDVLLLHFDRMHSADLERICILRRRLGTHVMIAAHRANGSSLPLRADIEVSCSCELDDLLTIAMNVGASADQAKQSGLHRVAMSGRDEP
ncbi:MAG: hypothetical protein U0165_15520 [Polyangiaceae bacterium]